MKTSVNWKQVGLFLTLTFGLTWLLDLALALTIGYGHPATTLVLQVQMLIPALCAIVLEMFVFKRSALYHMRVNKDKPRFFYFCYLACGVIFALMAAWVIIAPSQSALLTASVVTQALSLLCLIVLGVVHWLSESESSARAHLIWGTWQQWLVYSVAVVLFYALQTLLNWLFGLGQPANVAGIMAQSLPPEAQTMSPTVFRIVAGIQSVLLGAFLSLPIAFGEEYGWRGYLQQALIKLGRIKGIALLGVIWGVWHAPIIWMGHNYPDYPVLGTLLMTLYTIGLSFVLGYVVLKTGSVLLAAFLHAINNQVQAFLMVLMYTPYNPVLSFGLGLYGLLTLGLIVVLLLRDPVWKARA